jgi:hypothetical protein
MSRNGTLVLRWVQLIRPYTWITFISPPMSLVTLVIEPAYRPDRVLSVQMEHGGCLNGRQASVGWNAVGRHSELTGRARAEALCGCTELPTKFRPSRTGTTEIPNVSA